MHSREPAGLYRRADGDAVGAEGGGDISLDLYPSAISIQSAESFGVGLVDRKDRRAALQGLRERVECPVFKQTHRLAHGEEVANL